MPRDQEEGDVFLGWTRVPKVKLALKDIAICAFQAGMFYQSNGDAMNKFEKFWNQEYVQEAVKEIENVDRKS